MFITAVPIHSGGRAVIIHTHRSCSNKTHTRLGSSQIYCTCPPLSSPHAHSFVIGPAVIKRTRGGFRVHTPKLGTPPWVARAVLADARCPAPLTSFCPLPSKHLGKPATARQVVNPNGRGAVTPASFGGASCLALRYLLGTCSSKVG